MDIDPAIGIMKPASGIWLFAQRFARWPLAVALAGFAIERTIGIFDRTRDFYEGGGVMIVTQGGWARPEWLNGPQYTLTPWGPGYHTLVALLGRIGLCDDPLMLGRTVSLVAGLLTAAAIAIAVIQATRKVEAGLLAAAVFLSYSGIAFWMETFRIDALATLLAIAAYVIPPAGAGLYASAALVGLGSLVKQTVMLAAIPVTIYLLLARRRSDAIRYATSTAAIVVIGWVAVSAASSGYYFSMAWLANRRTYAFGQTLFNTVDFLRHWGTYAALLALAFAGRSGALSRSRYALAMIVAWVAASAMSGVEGAATNFFLESAALAAIVIGIHGVAELQARWPAMTSMLLWGVSAVLVISAAATTTRQISERRPLGDFGKFRETLANPSVLSDWRYILAARGSGLQPVVNDPFFMTVAARNHRFPIDRLAAEVRSGQVAGLILHGPMPSGDELGGWPPELVSEFRAHFEAAGTVGEAHLYRFQGPPPRTQLK